MNGRKVGYKSFEFGYESSEFGCMGTKRPWVRNDWMAEEDFTESR